MFFTFSVADVFTYIALWSAIAIVLALNRRRHPRPELQTPPPPGVKAIADCAPKPIRILVLGAGLAGYSCMQSLLKWKNKLHRKLDVTLTLVDVGENHCHSSLLNQVATGALESWQISQPVATTLEVTAFERWRQKILRVDLRARMVFCESLQKENDTEHLKMQSHTYDVLMMAPGAVSDFGKATGALQNSFAVRTLDEAERLKNHIAACFDTASVEENEDVRAELLCFVISGGGANGIELTFGISDLIFENLLPRYPSLKKEMIKLYLVHSGAQVLHGWPRSVSNKVTKKLSEKNVIVICNGQVTAVEKSDVTLSDGRSQPTQTCVWTAGTAAHPLASSLGLECAPNGRVQVDPHLAAGGFSNVFCIGDFANCIDTKTLKAHAACGEVSISQGVVAAENAYRLLLRKEPRVYRHSHRVRYLALGHRQALVSFWNVSIGGRAGWLMFRWHHFRQMRTKGAGMRLLMSWGLDLFSRDVVRTTGTVGHTVEKGIQKWPTKMNKAA